uniref:Uncharacterized protein n=1 Tax=Arundo donax TaxID=35708 RepID=A0A0A9BBG6_ARUDO
MPVVPSDPAGEVVEGEAGEARARAAGAEGWGASAGRKPLVKESRKLRRSGGWRERYRRRKAGSAMRRRRRGRDRQGRRCGQRSPPGARR